MPPILIEGRTNLSDYENRKTHRILRQTLTGSKRCALFILKCQCIQEYSCNMLSKGKPSLARCVLRIERAQLRPGSVVRAFPFFFPEKSQGRLWSRAGWRLSSGDQTRRARPARPLFRFSTETISSSFWKKARASVSLLPGSHWLLPELSPESRQLPQARPCSALPGCQCRPRTVA